VQALALLYGRGTAQGEKPVKFRIEIEREDDGRWIAEISELPGVMAYGKTRQEAIAKVEALALRVVADQTEERKTPIKSSRLSFACSR
jgi:predicted RNase H-like HicB family nuclease